MEQLNGALDELLDALIAPAFDILLDRCSCKCATILSSNPPAVVLRSKNIAGSFRPVADVLRNGPAAAANARSAPALRSAWQLFSSHTPDLP